MTLESLLSGVTDCVTALVTAMSGNIVTSALLGMGLVGAAAGLFYKMKKSAK